MRPGLLFGPPLRRGAPTRMSTKPLVPKVRICRPVRASISRMPLLAVRMSRRSERSLLSQYARPRSVARSVDIHSSLPVVASSATTTPRTPVTYMTLSTMSGLKRRRSGSPGTG